MTEVIMINMSNYNELMNGGIKEENACLVDIRQKKFIVNKLNSKFNSINIPVEKLTEQIDELKKVVPIFHDGNGMLVSCSLAKLIALKLPKIYIMSNGCLTESFAE